MKLALILDNLKNRLSVPLLEPANVETEIAFDEGRFHLDFSTSGEKYHLRVELLSGSATLFASLQFTMEDWSKSDYVLLPGAIYDGNRARVIEDDYPPQAPLGFIEVNPPPLIGPIQHLAPDGGGMIEQTSGEYAFPCFGCFSRSKKQSRWILTAPGNEAGNYSYTVKESKGGTHLKLFISSPLHRVWRQCYCRKVPADDSPVTLKPGETLTFEFMDIQKKTESMARFFRQTYDMRNLMVSPGKQPELFPISGAVRLITDYFEQENWIEKYGYYSTIPPELIACGNISHYQLGWVGGGMVTEFMLKQGTDIARKHALRELDFIFRNAARPSGFFYTSCCHDTFAPDRLKSDGDQVLTRKNGDALYYLCRQMLYLKNQKYEIPEFWLSSLKKNAEAFLRMWRKYGQFGYRFNADSGEIIIGGSTGGAIVCGGLALASELFEEPAFLLSARESVRYYAKNYLDKGFVNGGAGDALQSPDSESAYALLDSLITVWERCGDPALLDYARFAADYNATWCVSYDYPFPSDSTFGTLDMTTGGTIYANSQNRHAAPGICSYGGDALFKLYRATGERRFADLLRAIVHAIPQYVSRPDRPIDQQHPGWINERVNMGDWEGRARIGEIFKGSCWPALSMLFARVQIPGVYANVSSGDVICFDHVMARFAAPDTLEVHNPTSFPAAVTVLIENMEEASHPLKTEAQTFFRGIKVAPGENGYLCINVRCN